MVNNEEFSDIVKEVFEDYYKMYMKKQKTEKKVADISVETIKNVVKKTAEKKVVRTKKK